MLKYVFALVVLFCSSASAKTFSLDFLDLLNDKKVQAEIDMVDDQIEAFHEMGEQCKAMLIPIRDLGLDPEEESKLTQEALIKSQNLISAFIASELMPHQSQRLYAIQALNAIEQHGFVRVLKTPEDYPALKYLELDRSPEQIEAVFAERKMEWQKQQSDLVLEYQEKARQAKLRWMSEVFESLGTDGQKLKGLIPDTGNEIEALTPAEKDDAKTTDHVDK